MNKLPPIHWLTLEGKMNNIKTLPPTYWLTLEGETQRQKQLNKQFDNYGIKNHTSVYGYDGRKIDYKNNEIVSGVYFESLSSGDIACAMSHLKMIKHWYDTSNSPYALFLEDDVNLENSENWSFSWDDFFRLLPKKWNAIQLCLIKTSGDIQVKFRNRVTADWSATAYLLTREYAAKLLSDYYVNGKWFLEIKDDKRARPLTEDLIYFPGRSNVYTFPIFAEKVDVPSNYYKDQSKIKESNARSERIVTEWWKKNGLKTSISTLMGKTSWPSDSIPVIGTAIVSNPFWLKKLISSVDYPVENFFIVNNNGRGQIDKELDEIVKTPHPFIKKMKVVHMPANIGVSGAWNLIIKCYMSAPFWIIVNDDVSFGEGFLKEMHQKSMEDETVGLIHGHHGDFGIGSWDLFLIRDHIIQTFGLFDENLYPAYNEDTDYLLRFIHRPIKKVLSLSSMYYHGNGKKEQYNLEGSQTEKSEPALKDKLNLANESNLDYMNKKWGTGWRYCNPSVLPFKDKPISYTTYDLGFVREKNLGF